MFKKNNLNMELKYVPIVNNRELSFITDSMSKSLKFEQSEVINKAWVADAKNFILNPKSVALSAGRETAWNNGWALCLQEACDSSSLESFYPHYIRNASDTFLVNCVPSKFMADSPELLMAELSADNIIAMASKLGAEYIVEIGCGTGWRLELLRRRGWNGGLLGGDFTDSSEKCITMINEIVDAKIEFKKFDMLENNNLSLPNNTLIYTYGALEQIGSKWNNFFKFCNENKSKLSGCMHFEPFSSLYQLTNYFDRYSLAIHKAKNYLDGYLEALIQEYCTGKVDLSVARLPLGARLLETANYVGWRHNTNE